MFRILRRHFDGSRSQTYTEAVNAAQKKFFRRVMISWAENASWICFSSTSELMCMPRSVITWLIIPVTISHATRRLVLQIEETYQYTPILLHLSVNGILWRVLETHLENLGPGRLHTQRGAKVLEQLRTKDCPVRCRGISWLERQRTWPASC